MLNLLGISGEEQIYPAPSHHCTRSHNVGGSDLCCEQACMLAVDHHVKSVSFTQPASHCYKEMDSERSRQVCVLKLQIQAGADLACILRPQYFDDSQPG